MGEWPAGYDPYKLNTQLRLYHREPWWDIYKTFSRTIAIYPAPSSIICGEWPSYCRRRCDHCRYAGQEAYQRRDSRTQELPAQPQAGFGEISMDTASFQFVVFGLAIVLLSNFSRSRHWRSIVLMLASIAFLGLLAHNPIVFLPLAGFLLLRYGGLILIGRGWVQVDGLEHYSCNLRIYMVKKYTFLQKAAFCTIPISH